MAVSSQISQNKRGREQYWNGGLTLPEEKRTNSGFKLEHDSDLMAFLDKIDNMDNNEETDTANELESEIRLIGVIKSLEDEIGLKGKTDNKIASTDEKGSADQMGSFKQGELAVEGSYSEATSVCDMGDLTYYDDVHAVLDFLVEYISPNEHGIIIDNYIDGDSIANIVYSDGVHVHGYAEVTEDFYGSLWEHDIWGVG